MVCHTQCISSIPNNCGLPAEMSAYMHEETAPPSSSHMHVEEAPPIPKKSRLNKDPKPSPSSSKPATTKEKKKKKFSKKASGKKGALLHMIAKNLSGDGSSQTGSDQDIPVSDDAMVDAMADVDPSSTETEEVIGPGCVNGNGVSHDKVERTNETSSNGSENGVTSDSGRWSSPPAAAMKMPKIVPSIYSAGFDSSKVIRMEKMSYPR